MNYPATTLMILCFLLPTLGNANSETKPENEPAQSLNQPPVAVEKTPATPTASRGQLLYENHCTKCHESQVHIRANRKSKSIADVQGWVTKWQAQQQLEWGESEITDVTGYLVERYYQFK